MWIIAIALALMLGALFGFVISLFPRDFPVLVAPIIGVIVIICVWALPEVKVPPSKWVPRILVLVAFLIGTWPSYISIILPGIPWINPTRLLLVLAVLAGAISLSISSSAKSILGERFRCCRRIFVAMIILHAAQLASLPLGFSSAIDASKSWVLYQFFTFFTFFLMVVFVPSEKSLRAILFCLLAGTLLNGLTGPIEFRMEQNIWLSLMPDRFIASDPLLQIIAQGARRTADMYRTLGVFITALENAEYLAITAPLAIYLVIECRRLWLRALGVAIYILAFVGIFFSGSRLGFVGMLIGTLVYLFIWGFKMWKTKERTILGAATLTLFPAITVTIVGLILTSYRLRVLFLGGGATTHSDQGRLLQWQLGIPIAAESPVIGSGYGTGARQLGVTGPRGNLTIDSYFLSVLLETGLIGLISFASMIIFGVWLAARVYSTKTTPGADLGAAIAGGLSAFFFVKMVLSQIDNHAVAYMYLAATVLIYCWSQVKNGQNAPDTRSTADPHALPESGVRPGN